MNLSDLPLKTLTAALDGPGLRLSVPPYRCEIRCREPGFAAALQSMYANYALAAPEAFIDIDIEVVRRRKWLAGQWRPRLWLGVGGNFPFNPLPTGQAFPMFEWGMNWCVTNYLHTRISFHAAALSFPEHDGSHGAVVLPGEPGAGKSTLTAAALERGFTLVSDELSLLDPATGTLLRVPRPISLKNAAIDVIRQRQPDAVITAPVADTTKGTVAHVRPPADSLSADLPEPVPRLLLFPEFVAGAPLTLTSRTRGAALVALARQSFNFHLHGSRGFELLASRLGEMDCYAIRYGALDEALDALEGLVADRRART